VALLLGQVAGVPEEGRGARFVCVAAWSTPEGLARSARGECRGRLLGAPRGSLGFGYDPIFLPEGEGLSMAELDPARKNVLSHRARAFRALLEILEAESLGAEGPAPRTSRSRTGRSRRTRGGPGGRSRPSPR
jgi:XTP/dITP diphosphohydrolase